LWQVGPARVLPIMGPLKMPPSLKKKLPHYMPKD